MIKWRWLRRLCCRFEAKSYQRHFEHSNYVVFIGPAQKGLENFLDWNGYVEEKF